MRLAIRLGGENRPVEPDRFQRDRLGHCGFIREDMPPASLASAFCPQSMSMKERRPVALAEGHRADLDLCPTLRPIRIAVEGRMLRRLRQGRHHIGERRELEPVELHHARGETLRCEAAPHRLQQRHASRQRQREGAPAAFHPLDPLGRTGAGLLDAPHDAFPFRKSSSPRFSSSSLTRRFGTLP